MLGKVGGQYNPGFEIAKDASPQPIFLRHRLEQAKQRNTEHTARIDRALSLLEKYPEVEELIDLLGQIGY